MATRTQKRKLSEQEDNNQLSVYVKNETTKALLIARGLSKLFPI
jgi:hypothetical protein